MVSVQQLVIPIVKLYTYVDVYIEKKKDLLKHPPR